MTSPTTPLISQYQRIKQEYNDAVLFFRLGDFYEMFFDDAVSIAPILGLTLTQRMGVPMCGVPHHVYRSYAAKLIAKGKKVAICDQVDNERKQKNIINREVTELLTPGTLTDDSMLDPDSNNYLLAVYYTEAQSAFAWIDISTTEFFVTSVLQGNSRAKFTELLERLSPREVLINEEAVEIESIEQVLKEHGVVVNSLPDWHFKSSDGFTALCRLLNLINLKSMGLEKHSPELLPIPVLLSYVEASTKHVLRHIQTVQVEKVKDYLLLDDRTQRALDLVQNSNTNDTRFTLLSVLKHGKTPMGNRLIRKNILAPLHSLEKINHRLNAVEFLINEQGIIEQSRRILASIQDIERLAAKIALQKAVPKDVLATALTLNSCIELAGTIPTLLPMLVKEKNTLITLGNKITETLLNPLPSDPTTMPFIKDGVSKDLDDTRALMKEGKQVLDKYLLKEQERTGVPLSLKYNRQLGYVFEVANKYSESLPPDFIRRQSITNRSRFSTKELTELELRISNSERNEKNLESGIFSSLLKSVAEHIPLLLAIGKELAFVDMVQAFAWVSLQSGFTRPEIVSDKRLIIEGGRHPVVETALPSGNFVPNDLELCVEDTTFLLITGPNMAGKSTYLRQNALIVLMAQLGCFVPARHAVIGLVDNIFCRVGATDNLARGESTFLTEMNETSFILRQATERSLVIMDEVGRGTTMLDGVAIAWAVCEFLLNTISCRTLFATHYHELTELAHTAIRNVSLRVDKLDDTIVFLKQIQDGPATQSYGIDVARLAGLPLSVVERARACLRAFDTKALNIENLPEVSPETKSETPELFTSKELLFAEIQSLNLDNITPLDAMNVLFRIKQELDN